MTKPDPICRSDCRRCLETSHGAPGSVLAQDIRIACLATYEYFGPAGGPAAGAAACGTCRKPGWSSPLSSSKAGPSPRSLAATESLRAGSANSSPATEPRGSAAFEPRSRRPRTYPGRVARGHGRADPATAEGALRRGPERRAGHHRLAPRSGACQGFCVRAGHCRWGLIRSG